MGYNNSDQVGTMFLFLKYSGGLKNQMTKIMTEGPKIQKKEDGKYCFALNIQSNLHKVNFDMLIL